MNPGEVADAIAKPMITTSFPVAEPEWGTFTWYPYQKRAGEPG
jgi:hypothetical protein